MTTQMLDLTHRHLLAVYLPALVDGGFTIDNKQATMVMVINISAIRPSHRRTVRTCANSNVLYDFPILEQIRSNNGTRLDTLVSPEYVKNVLHLRENQLSEIPSEDLGGQRNRMPMQYRSLTYITLLKFYS